MELTIGDRIRFVRQFRGLTQTELAERLDCLLAKTAEFVFHNTKTGRMCRKRKCWKRSVRY